MSEKQAELNHQPQTIFKMVFDMPLKISCNAIYSGVHYRSRMKHKSIYRWEVLRAISAQHIQPISNYPVALIFKFSFSKHPLDASNCSYMAKLIEDGLVQQKIFDNDDIKFVKKVTLESVKADKDEIHLEVTHDPEDKPRIKVKRINKTLSKHSQDKLFG